MQPVYKRDKNVGYSGHSGCLKSFCSTCGEFLWEYPTPSALEKNHCKCGKWVQTDEFTEEEILIPKKSKCCNKWLEHLHIDTNGKCSKCGTIQEMEYDTRAVKHYE